MRAILLLAFVAMTPMAVPAAAQMSTGATPVRGRLVAAEVRRLLEANYVLPDVRPKLDAILARGIASGHYDISDPDELVNRINADLHQVTPDKHLSAMYNPEASAKLAAAPPD